MQKNFKTAGETAMNETFKSQCDKFTTQVNFILSEVRDLYDLNHPLFAEQDAPFNKEEGKFMLPNIAQKHIMTLCDRVNETILELANTIEEHEMDFDIIDFISQTMSDSKYGYGEPFILIVDENDNLLPFFRLDSFFFYHNGHYFFMPPRNEEDGSFSTADED